MAHFRIEYVSKTGGPVRSAEYVTAGTLLAVEKIAQSHYKDRDASGYLIFDGDTQMILEEWDERYDASWP